MDPSIRRAVAILEARTGTTFRRGLGFLLTDRLLVTAWDIAADAEEIRAFFPDVTVACRPTPRGGDRARGWVVLDVDAIPGVPVPPVAAQPEGGEPWDALALAPSGPIPVSGSVTHEPYLNPVHRPLTLHIRTPGVRGSELTGSPVVVQGAVVGVITGRGEAFHRSLVRASSIKAVYERFGIDAATQPGPTTRAVPPAASRWPTKPPKMVGWYDPGELARTTGQLLISGVFGEYADFRVTEAGYPTRFEHALTPARDDVRELWIDYVADCGDGLNSTYAVASALSLPRLPLQKANGEWVVTRPGHILIFGGDQVYPTASREDYLNRFIVPYTIAAPASEEHGVDRAGSGPGHPWTQVPAGATVVQADGSSPASSTASIHPMQDFVGMDDEVDPDSPLPPVLPWVVGIPGNHDWYDNLVGFMRLFCNAEKLSRWNTVQSRSYFVKKLPWGWWLFGVDVQLRSEMDQEQLRYFTRWIDQMEPGDKVILAIAEPFWNHEVDHGAEKALEPTYLSALEETLSRRNHLKVYLAGDLHHYRRHESADRIQKITAGGGGAFLHPTHPEAPYRNLKGFVLKKSYPDARTSWWLTWRNLLFPFINPWFGVLTMVLYLLGTWVLVPAYGAKNQAGIVGMRTIWEFGDVLLALTGSAAANPVAGLYILFVWFGVRAFSATPSRAFNWIGGMLHGLAHVVAICFLFWLSAHITMAGFDMQSKSLGQLLASLPIVLVGGWLIGPMIVGIYLILSLNLFGQHKNEAFSSLRGEDWKQFIRMRITPESLTLYPIGLRRVPRHWAPRPQGASGPEYWPDDPLAIRPELIEEIEPLRD